NEYASLIGEKEIMVEDGDVIPVDASARTIEMPVSQQDKLKSLTLADGSTVAVDQSKSGIAIPDVIPEMFEYFIVGDDIFDKLGEPVKSTETYDWQVVKGDYDDIIEVGEMLSEQYMAKFFAVDYIVYTIEKVYAPIMFVGLFI